MRVLALLLGIILLLFGLAVGGCSITLLLVGVGEREWWVLGAALLLIGGTSIAGAVRLFRGKAARNPNGLHASHQRDD